MYKPATFFSLAPYFSKGFKGRELVRSPRNRQFGGEQEFKVAGRPHVLLPYFYPMSFGGVVNLGGTAGDGYGRWRVVDEIR